ncbi:formate dehydrogenase subunit gamma [Roseateles sp.]|uniref:formate dehydrogenase subunit gamma n=1 Tax=Roseateles sp. TaxID=1971397 RepID=UPI003BA4CE45
MRSFFVSMLAGLSVSLACAQAAPAPAASMTQAEAVQTGAAPAGFVAPAEPKADESNAERAKSQPGNNAPFWRGVRDSGLQQGTSSLPGAEKGVLVQPFVQYPGSHYTTAGEAWRQVRNQWIIPYGGALIVITLLALALFYFSKGSLGGHQPDTGRQIERFTYFERAAHWCNAIAFSVLAISGLVMAFGKFFMLPVLGATLFGWLSYVLKTAHNFAGPLFAVSLLVVFFTFVRDNLPNRHDLVWLLKGGGLFGGHEVPSERFNAGEKVVFWGGVFLLGFVAVASGLVLDQLVPGMAYLRGDMQIAHMVHAVSTLLMMVLFLGHIYMGTIGMKGAFNAMKTGQVDEGWAREHHELWYEDIKAGKIPAQRSAPQSAGVAASKPATQL